MQVNDWLSNRKFHELREPLKSSLNSSLLVPDGCVLIPRTTAERSLPCTPATLDLAGVNWNDFHLIRKIENPPELWSSVLFKYYGAQREVVHETHSDSERFPSSLTCDWPPSRLKWVGRALSPASTGLTGRRFASCKVGCVVQTRQLWGTGARSYLTECIYQLVLTSQLPHRLVNSVFTIAI